MGNLTNAQKSIWVTEQYYKGSSINNICGTAVIQEKVDFEKLKESIQIVCKKHDNFWLEFKLNKGNVEQVLSEKKEIQIDTINIAGKNQLETERNKIVKTKFTLENSKLFKFYIFIEKVEVEDLGPTWLGFYKEYYHLVDLIMEGKRDYSIGLTPSFDVRDYETLFYNDFNIRNKKIKGFYEKLKELPFFWFNAVPYIKQYAVLNKERESLKESISDVGVLKDYDLTEFFKLMDEAMDEMPSGVLNGLTPNQLKEKQNKEVARQIAKEKARIRQKDACLSSKDADLFYELYFAVLDFVNKKYSINNKLKIYRGKGLDPNELSVIVDKFWSEKDSIIDEFCNKNPYKFNDEELEMVKNFKKGIRNMFIICDYLEDYTAVMGKDRCYMIKGLTCNIDEVIEYETLPAPTMMIIFPFKDVLVYDGMIATYPIKIGSAMEDMIMADYNKSIKYYHL